jgi:O-acetyl-ADP-ribose deacetylase (regulator of RNase III)
MSINYIKGNALHPIKKPAFLCHVVNNVGKFGAGFALSMAKEYPHAKLVYMEQAAYKMGDTIPAMMGKDFAIIHLIAQKGLPSARRPKPADLEALKTSLLDMRTMLPSGFSVHMPKVCTGYGGYTWEEVLPVIEESLKGVEVYIYELQ